MPSAPSSRSRLVTAVVAGAALVLLVATLLSISHTEPDLRPAASVPTTTTTSSTMTAPFRPPDPASESSSESSIGSASESSIGSSSPSSTDSVPTTATAIAPTGLEPLPVRTSEVATVRPGVDVVPVHAAADGGEVTQTVPATGDYGQAQVFLVANRSGARLEVLLPVRPNGSRGWIDASLVDVARHDYQIQVSLSGYRMLVQRGSEVVIDTAIGVGTQDTPTLGGDFYTWVLVDPTNAGYGSYAYGLSGFSTLEQFAGGDGRMGIHGTTDDSSIGRDVSRGCVRVPDDVVMEMVEEVGLPLGVPVTILA